MNSSKSLSKPSDKVSFKPVSPFELYYQLTYMSAIASAGLSRNKLFEVSSETASPVASYFVAINTLVKEFRFDYPDACRRVGSKAKTDNMKSFLLRFSDALRSGEPLADFLAREAEVQGEEHKNRYERDLESLKQWSNAFTSIVISVALIVIIQIITSMIYSMNRTTIGGLVSSGVMMGFFGAWIIYRSAPNEILTIKPGQGSPEQIRAYNLFKILGPISIAVGVLMKLVGLDLGWVLVFVGAMMLPVGIISLKSDKLVTKKDLEFSTFLRSAGSMATSSGTTLKQALTRIDLSSFPTLEPDITRLSNRLQALVEPEICWRRFGYETGSRLISDAITVFFGAIKLGGDPERVGYLCSLFVARTTQLRAKRRLTASTFSALSIIIQTVVAVLMVFVLSVVNSFAVLMGELMPKNVDDLSASASMSLGMAQFSPADLQFLGLITVGMIILLALVCAASIWAASGGYRLKFFFYLSLALFVSAVGLLAVPPAVAGILRTSVR